MSRSDPIDSRSSLPVLLAAEDGNFNAFVIYVFQQIGVEVVAEPDGKRLDKRLSELKPDVLLVGSTLAGIDVRTLCATLRLERETRSLATLVLLVSDDERHDAEFLASGADECLMAWKARHHALAIPYFDVLMFGMGMEEGCSFQNHLSIIRTFD